MSVNPKENIELRLRTLQILWLGLTLSVGVYYAVTLFAERPEDLEPNNVQSLALIVVALSTTLISFAVKNKLLSKAIEARQVPQVQQAYIVAWAMVEVAALLGILEFFTTNNPYYYVLFIIAAGAQLLHFPRRDHVANAAFKPGF